MMGQYNSLRGAKAFVAAYNKHSRKTRCFWRARTGARATRENANILWPSVMADCWGAGYTYCAVYAINGSLTEVGILARNLASQEYNERRKRQQRQNNADMNALLGGVINGLGAAMGTTPTPSYQRNVPVYNSQSYRQNVPSYNSPSYRPSPTYNSPSSGSSSGGPVCTPSQKARGWSDDRCAVN